MSIFGALKKIPEAVSSYEADLPRSDATFNFPGKGLLTALVDRSGSEIQRRRDFEDSIRNTKLKPMLEAYIHNGHTLSDEEREVAESEIRSVVGGGKHSKAFLDKIFETVGQVHKVGRIMQPPPGMASQAATGATQAAGQDQAEGEGSLSTTPTPGPGAGSEGEGVQSVAPVSPVLAPPPNAAAPVAPASAAATQPALTPPPTETPATTPETSPRNSAMAKLFPHVMTQEEQMAQQQKNAIELSNLQSEHAVNLMREQIDAGRFEKGPTKVTGNEVDPETGKVFKVVHWYDGTQEIKKDVLGEQPRNWATKPTRVFLMRDGQLISALMDPLTNKTIAGSERNDIAPPAALLPRISERDWAAIDDDGQLVTIPLRSQRGVQLPNGQGGTGAPGAAPASPLAPPPFTGAPDEDMIAFMQKRNPNAPREEIVKAMATMSPQSMADLRQVAGLSAEPGGAPAAPTTTQAPVTGGPSTMPAPLESREFPGVNTPGGYNASTQRAIPVREAYTQMVGSPDFPDSPSLMSFSKIADDPVRSAKLAKALKLTFDGLDQQEKAHGSLVNLFKLYAGIPAAEIGAEVSTYTAGIGDMLADDPELQAAYNAEMATFATAVGLRSLTRAGAAEASVNKIEREIPLIGLNSFNSRDFHGKLGRLLLEVYNGAKNTPTMRKEVPYIKQKVDELNRLAAGTGITPPPTGQKTPAAIRIKNPKTGERLESTDGGQTWHKPQ